MEKTDYHVRGIKPSISEELLEELRYIAPHVRYNLINIRRIAATRARIQRVLIKHVQMRQSMNTKPSKKGYLCFYSVKSW